MMNGLSVISKKTLRKQVLLSRLQQLINSSTAHGMNKLVQPDSNWPIKVAWFLIFICAVCGVTIHTATVIKLYFSYPVSSTVRQKVNGFEFPDVTICDTMLKKFFLYNVSHYDQRTADRDYSRYSKAVQTMLGYQFGWESKKFLKAIYIASGHKFNMSEVSARAEDLVLYCEFDQKPCSFENFSLYYDREYGNCYTFRPQSRELEKAGADMGLIMVLYPPSVDANFDEDRIMKTTTGLESKGFQITVHQRDTQPDPHEFGITAPVGMRADFALSQTQIQLANTNTRPCSPAGKQTFWNPFLRTRQEYENRLYNCVDNEDANHIQDICRCTIEGLIPVTEKRLLSADYCHDILDMQRFNASRFRQLSELVEKIWNKYTEKTKQKYARLIVKVAGSKAISAFPELADRLRNVECANNYLPKQTKSECLNECQHSEYASAIALAEWPDRSFTSRGSLIRTKKLGSVLADYTRRVANCTPPVALVTSLRISNRSVSGCKEDDYPNLEQAPLENTTCRDLQTFVSNTLVQVRVYPKTLTIRMLLEVRSYELEKLFSDIGGILGLWVGISVITIFELGEIAVLTAVYLYNMLHAKAGGVDHLRRRCPRRCCEGVDLSGDEISTPCCNGTPLADLQQQVQQQQQQQQQQQRLDLEQEQELDPPWLQSLSCAGSSRSVVCIRYDVETNL